MIYLYRKVPSVRIMLSDLKSYSQPPPLKSLGCLVGTLNGSYYVSRRAHKNFPPSVLSHFGMKAFRGVQWMENVGAKLEILTNHCFRAHMPAG